MKGIGGEYKPQKKWSEGMKVMSDYEGKHKIETEMALDLDTLKAMRTPCS